MGGWIDDGWWTDLKAGWRKEKKNHEKKLPGDETANENLSAHKEGKREGN